MKEVVSFLREKRLTVTTMESCTGGALASAITNVEGASDVFSGAYVAYANEQKIRLGVPAGIIGQYGVYSPETATAMADVCRRSFAADIGIGVTGVFANPDPNNSDGCAMVVHYAILWQEQEVVRTLQIPSAAGVHGRESLKAYVVCAIVRTLKEIADFRERCS